MTVRLSPKQFDDLCARASAARCSLPALVRAVLTRAAVEQKTDGK